LARGFFDVKQQLTRQGRKLPLNRQKLRLSPQHGFTIAEVTIKGV
jgi:hypothetical protein